MVHRADSPRLRLYGGPSRVVACRPLTITSALSVRNRLHTYERIADSMTTQAAPHPRGQRVDVSRMCPATDGKRLQEVGQRRSSKLLVNSTFGVIRQVLETA
jgi:hypothetical protein